MADINKNIFFNTNAKETSKEIENMNKNLKILGDSISKIDLFNAKGKRLDKRTKEYKDSLTKTRAEVQLLYLKQLELNKQLKQQEELEKILSKSRSKRIQETVRNLHIQNEELRVSLGLKEKPKSFTEKEKESRLETFRTGGLQAVTPKNLKDAINKSFDYNIGLKKEELEKVGGSDKKIESDINKLSIQQGTANTIINLINNGIKKINKMAHGVANIFENIFGFSLSIKEQFKDILKNINDTVYQMSTASMGESLITNVRARERQLKYGLSAGQGYALGQTMSILKMETDEDLMYMNKEQQKLFTRYMDKFSGWYDKLDSSGVLRNIQETQLDLAMLKQEVSVEFLTWVANNKDAIMAAINGIINIAKWLAEKLGKVLTAFSQNSSYSNLTTASDYTNTNNYNSKVNNVNISMNNNATGVLSSQENLEAFFEEQMSNMVSETVASLK